MSESSDELDKLRNKWSNLYRNTLPSLAKARDAAQPIWPVTLDHCFARIILDNTIGKKVTDKAEDSVVPWDTVIKKPAVRNMDRSQLQAAISLGEQIQRGEISLAEFDRRSLAGRGKNEQKYAVQSDKDDQGEQKRKRGQDDTTSNRDLPKGTSPNKRRKSDDGKKQATLPFKMKNDSGNIKGESKQLPSPPSDDNNPNKEQENSIQQQPSSEFFQQTLDRINSHPGLTPYRKRLYAALLSVPRGEYTTYQAMADYLNSSARAVGNGMRNNPFAPDVPCHRVLASDRSIGGFYGSWGKDGKYADKKITLLKDEGIKFDSKGMVRGPVWRGFKDLAVDSSV